MLQPFRPRRKKEFDPLIVTSTFDVTGGLFSDTMPAKIEDKYMSNCKNVYINENKIKQRFGYTEFGGNLPLSLPIVGIFQVYSYSGSTYLLAFTTEKVYKYNTATKDWDSITDSAADYTGSADELFSLDVIYDDNAAEIKYVSTNRTDNVKKWNGSGNFDDLGGSPNKCAFLKNFHHYLMLFDVVDGATRFPQRVDWSDQGLPETWTGGSSGNNNLAKTSDFIIGAEIIRNQLAIFKEHSITMCSYVGGTNPFTFEENKVKGIGCNARETIKSIGERLIFLGEDNVYIFDGFSCIPVANRVINKILENTNPDKVERSHAHLMEKYGLYLLCIPKSNSSYPDSIWVYDYIRDNWNYWESAADMVSSGYYLSAGALTIGELTGTIGSLNWKVGSSMISNSFPFSLFGDKDGYIYQWDETQLSDNGTAIEASVETKSYLPVGIGRFARNVSFSVYGMGDSVDIFTSIDGGSTYNKQGNIVLSLNNVDLGICRTVEKTSERIIYKIQNSVLDTFFEIEGWELKSLIKGKKVTQSYLEPIYIDYTYVWSEAVGMYYLSRKEIRVDFEDYTGKQEPVYIRK